MPEWIANAIVKLIRAKDKAYRKCRSSWIVLKVITRKMIRTRNNCVHNATNPKGWWYTKKYLSNKKKTLTLAVLNGYCITIQNIAID